MQFRVVDYSTETLLYRQRLLHCLKSNANHEKDKKTNKTYLEILHLFTLQGKCCVNNPSSLLFSREKMIASWLLNGELKIKMEIFFA